MNLPPNGKLWAKLRDGSEIVFDPAMGRSKQIEEIINQMMSPDPEERPTIDEILQHPFLQRFLNYEDKTHKSSKSMHNLSAVAFSGLGAVEKDDDDEQSNMGRPRLDSTNQTKSNPNRSNLHITPTSNTGLSSKSPYTNKSNTKIVISPQTIAREQ